MSKLETPAEAEACPRTERLDEPTLCMILTAYKVAKTGGSFKGSTSVLQTLADSGAPVPQSRRGRHIAKNIARCTHMVMKEDDSELIAKATHITLTQDKRNGFLVTRALLTFGEGLPSRFPLASVAPTLVSSPT